MNDSLLMRIGNLLKVFEASAINKMPPLVESRLLDDPKFAHQVVNLFDWQVITGELKRPMSEMLI